MTDNYLVIRLTPSSAVDGATFATYLQGLEIDVYPANAPQSSTTPSATLLGSASYSSPLILIQDLGHAGSYLACVSLPTLVATAQTNIGKVLQFASTEGIPVGSYPFIFDAKGNNFFASKTTVTEVTKTTVTLSQDIPGYLPAYTIVSFILDYKNINPWANNTLFVTTKTDKVAQKTKTVLPFTSTTGIFFGMSVTTASPGFIADETTVIEVNSTSVTLATPKLSPPLLQDVPSGTAINFTYPLDTGIIQHLESTTFSIAGFDFDIFYPGSVATAIIPLSASPPPFFNISVIVNRGTDNQGTEVILVEDTYYNVQASTSPLPTTLDQYQDIPSQATNFYISLPAPPTNSNVISLTIPSDGTPPPFDGLYKAVTAALKADPTIAPAPKPVPDISSLTTDQCSQIAYDIVWSQQNILPTPPDKLEDLYTNPPNTGGSSGDGGNDEQDRQKFEGTLNSFYSTKKATAERLTKYVAAVSAAIYCEQKSLGSLGAQTAVLEFPVDPVNPSTQPAVAPSPVESEILLQGLSSSGINFGVPAAFFYALGTSLDKSTSGDQRYQMATGDTIERLLQEIGTAVSANVIQDAEGFSSSGGPVGTINSAQAARRLSALYTSSASSSPSVTLPSTGPLAQVVQAWLAAPQPVAGVPFYQSYQPSQDDQIWWSIEQQNPPQGAQDYLALVLAALTQGYVIPASGSNPAATLADKIAAWLPSLTVPQPPAAANVQTLIQVSAQQWTDFFTPPPPTTPPTVPVLTAPDPTWLPPFTQPVTPAATQPTSTPQPSYIATRIRAFIRAVQKFFTVSSVVSQALPPAPGSPSSFGLPSFDPITQAAQALFTGSSTFGSGSLTSAALTSAVQTVVPPLDLAAQAWLEQAITTINELCQVANGIPNITPNVSPVPASLYFSIVEALYARGFRSAKDITDLSPDDFLRALTGTVAYDYATTLYDVAKKIASPSVPTAPPSGTFQPINPDGMLINCIPAPCLSPTGPISYLQEMLRLSEASTCETPWPSEDRTLGDAIAARRGPLGNLLASCANLETPLPLIDIVNECLEYMGSVQSPTNGTVYDTSADALAGHTLCKERDCPKEDEDRTCHDPAAIFGALPEYSTPASPVAKNQSVEPQVYNNLKIDFSSCRLPYSQAIDVSRTYLRHFRTSRYEVMRTFRKCITEFVLCPSQEPAEFQSHLWRYPVRIDTAIEYLGITPEEYQLLFQGSWPQHCGRPMDDSVPQASGGVPVSQLYGFASSGEDNSWIKVVVKLPEFLSRTCLDYCEFLELWQAGFVKFYRAGDVATFPDCEPCCLDEYVIRFENQDEIGEFLKQLAIFIRLWRKLREVDGARYSFEQLRDICEMLQLFKNDGTINTDFVRQLAAFQMLRDHLGLKLTDKAGSQSSATIADRMPLLALWIENASVQYPDEWAWAIGQLLDHLQHYAERQHKCARRSPEFVKLLASNLDVLSRLAGFDPDAAKDTWCAQPTHTLRFAEVLAKIYASNFSIGEMLYLFTADDQLDGEEPFPLQEENEALDSPLSLPDDEHEYSLWQLRHKLLEVHLSDEEVCQWTWKRIEASLRDEFGWAPDDLLSFAQHFFPCALEASGYRVEARKRQFSTSLDPQYTVATMWNTPPGGPFQYDPNEKLLEMQLPLSDEDLIEQLTHVRPLNTQEQQAVQNLYFQPRTALAAFAFLFTDFDKAEKRLIEEREEHERWAYFQRQFALCHARCRILAEHLADHVAFVTGQECPEGVHVALLLLRELFADENKATTDWEDDSSNVLSVTWTPPNGGAFAALLGLTGTGLLREFTPDGGSVIWRDVSAVGAFGLERDRTNCPVPTVLPSMNLPLTQEQMKFVSVRNGLAMKDADGAWLGGAQGFSVKWTGALLIDEAGTYEFCADASTREGEKPDLEAAEHRKWRVTLKRGQRTWILLNHHWQGEKGHAVSSLPLKRGVYELIIEFLQPSPTFLDADELYPQHTGFQLKYAGPDSHGKLLEIPHSRLFRISKDQDLGAGITGLADDAGNFLRQYYTSSLRDIRRTYQRAFKALLFAHRFGLAAKCLSGGQSELGYMLAQKENFAGVSYCRTGGGFTKHAADFDFNFLPVQDDYNSPARAQDSRVQPSAQRTQALFDWWERIFDYDRVRKQVRLDCERHLWLLFEEAQEKQPAHPAYLLRHMCANSLHWQLDLHYYQDQNRPVYAVTSVDLADDRWVVRAWHADEWIRSLVQFFTVKDITRARPDLWASEDPSALVLPVEKETGNANLSAFLSDGCFKNGEPRRYGDVKRLNDGLRERGRDALLQYLCRMNRVKLPSEPGQPSQFAQVPRDLSDLLLLDVQVGICEKASRIEEAITAVQTFIDRSRLGLELSWKVSRAFARLWDSRFKTYRTWERCKRRELYRENWIEWVEFGRARRIEAFRFLESELRRSTLTLAAPGGLEWWPDEYEPLEHRPTLIQRRDPSELQPLSPPPSPWTSREGLDVLGTPERAGQPTWLASLQQGSASTPAPTPTPTQVVTKIAEPLVQAAALSTVQPLPLWMEAAMKLGTRFWRVAAAGVPQASLGFVPHSHEPHDVYCCECGHVHPVHVDEYYFWLVDAQHFSIPEQNTADKGYQGSYQAGIQDPYYDQIQQQSANWNDESQVPGLLLWQPNPAVRLAWCRVHNGEFGQPRRSEEVVLISGSPPPDLVFLGRAADSLYFSVNGGTTPIVSKDTSPPGFRYDLPTDRAVTLPLVTLLPKPNIAYPGGLPAYPFFAYDAPGARLFPESLFSPAFLVADASRAQCCFELALKWYKRVFDPLRCDCTWMNCPDDVSQGTTGSTSSIGTTGETVGVQGSPAGPTGVTVEVKAGSTGGMAGSASAPPATRAAAPPVDPVGVQPKASQDAVGNTPGQGACCDSTKVSDKVAQNRTLTLHYCQTLLDWGDALMRRRRSPEAFQQARLIYDTVAKITGRRPHTVLLEEPSGTPQPVATFTPAFAPLNPRLLDLYDLVADRLGLIHACLDARRLHDDRPNHDMSYYGDNPLREGWRSAVETCAEDVEWCHRHSPYRFVFLIQKAKEMAGQVRELGSALLSAFEKGDAEYLASIRAGHERELLALGLTIRQDQWRDADWQIQALQQTKEVNQTNLLYYSNLYQNGLINDEIQNQSLATTAMQTRTSGNITEAVGEALKVIPDLFIGFPCTDTQVPIGTKLAGVFETIARVMFTVADIQKATAEIDLTLAGWQRRSDEWFHQTQTLPIEIEQIEIQILGAQRRRAQALRELNNQERQIEQASEVQDFLRDKFTAQDLYLWLQKETVALHSKMYELALFAARQAERAFNFERGHTTRRFIPDETWDTLHEGLMAGERLEFALTHMDKAYLDENIREYELTKHFSLRLQFPMAYLQLKTTGYCEIDIPEWMFDLDFPGQYMRRIKNVTLTIPCVTGPYTGVHCRLTLLSSTTRIDPRLTPPPNRCCCDHRPRNEYETCPHDPRFVRLYAATEAIATSSGQNDSGMFELNFRDERYLPFEYLGAVSRWRIELPLENNQFDFDTLSDVILHLNYTAREGGEVLRRVANEVAQQHLPGAGVRYFDIRHEFADAWHRFQGSFNREEAPKHLGIRLSRDMFPFIPGRRELWINRLDIFFEAPEAEPGKHKVVKFLVEHRARQRDEDRDDREVHEITCIASDEWPDLYHGVLDIRLGPLAQRAEHDLGTFRFPANTGVVSRAFLLCGYDVAQMQSVGRFPMRSQWRK